MSGHHSSSSEGCRGGLEEWADGLDSVGGQNWVQGVTPGITMLAKGTVECWYGCTCWQPGCFLVGSLDEVGLPGLPSSIPAKAGRSCGCSSSKDRSGKSESILKYCLPEFNFLGVLDGLFCSRL